MAKTNAQKQADHRNSLRARQIEFFEDLCNELEVVNVHMALMRDKMQRAIKKMS